MFTFFFCFFSFFVVSLPFPPFFTCARDTPIPIQEKPDPVKELIGETFVGLTPAGVAIDARDTAESVKDFEENPGLRSGLGLFVAGIGWIPGLGDFIKGIFKWFRKTCPQTKKFIKKFGKSTNKTLINSVENATKKMGFKGEVTVLQGQNSKIGAAITENGDMIIWENSYIDGYVDPVYGRELKGNALVAHEVGHTKAEIPYGGSYDERNPKYWLRESQASAQGAKLGEGILTADEIKSLQEDSKRCYSYYEQLQKLHQNKY